MLTKEQEEKIKKAGDVYYEPNTTFGQAFVAAIKVYDELKDIEEVKAAVAAKAVETSDTDDCYAVFRPIRPELNDSMKEVKVFNSESQMLEKLNEKSNLTIAIDDEEFEDDETGWLHSHYVSSIRKFKGFHYIGETVGICDCKTFQKG